MPSVRKKLSDKKTKLAKRPQHIPDHPAMDTYEEGSFYFVPIENIEPNPGQPRKYFDKSSLRELSQSIKEKGILQPLIVKRQDNNTIFLVAGERRFRAAKLAGLSQVPVIITKGDPFEIAIIENLQRENLRSVEEAEALARMMDEHAYTQEQLSRIIGKSRVMVTETLSLNRLPEEIKEECRRVDTYPKRLLIQIARQKTPKAMMALFNRAKAANLKSDEVKEITRRQNRSHIDVAMDRIAGIKTYLEKIEPRTFNDPETARLKLALEELQAILAQILS